MSESNPKVSRRALVSAMGAAAAPAMAQGNQGQTVQPLVDPRTKYARPSTG